MFHMLNLPSGSLYIRNRSPNDRSSAFCILGSSKPSRSSVFVSLCACAQLGPLRLWTAYCRSSKYFLGQNTSSRFLPIVLLAGMRGMYELPTCLHHLQIDITPLPCSPPMSSVNEMSQNHVVDRSFQSCSQRSCYINRSRPGSSILSIWAANISARKVGPPRTSTSAAKNSVYRSFN